MLELVQIISTWPVGVSLAAAVVAQGLYVGRRRTALNEALHELRRPLQALALTAPGTRPQEPAIQGSVHMAATALERLEREINGQASGVVRIPLLVGPLLAAAVERWRPRAEVAGSVLTREESPDEAIVVGDQEEIARALDNLIVNAIEHGGPEIVVGAHICSGRLLVAVSDSGSESAPDPRPEKRPGLVARLSGRRLRGHGLRLVRRTAAAHGGDFRLLCSRRRTEAVLELPLVDGVD